MNTIWVAMLLICSGQEALGEATAYRSGVSERAMVECHTGVRHVEGKCSDYATPRKIAAAMAAMDAGAANDRVRRNAETPAPSGTPPATPASYNPINDTFPTIDDACMLYTWATSNRTNNWGSCMSMTTDSEYRYITTNSVPDFMVNPYCPIGLGYGYCTEYEIENDQCFFLTLLCGEENGLGSTPYGDVWIPYKARYKIPLKGNPTRSDRPHDMYDAPWGAFKDIGPAAGVAINGISVQGPNDAGDLSIDEAGFQLPCGGHVTPPMTLLNVSEGQGPSGPPMYHYHKSPECMLPFRNASTQVDHDGRPFEHAKLMGWAMDGFGIYAYQDVGGDTPIVDECGGHFGPVDDSGEVVYHYHSRQFAPYHLACQGPSLSKCSETQRGSNYCHAGCGADLCVQPGTDEAKFKAYLDQPEWDAEFLNKGYTINNYKVECVASAAVVSRGAAFLLVSVVALFFTL